MLLIYMRQIKGVNYEKDKKGNEGISRSCYFRGIFKCTLQSISVMKTFLSLFLSQQRKVVLEEFLL